MRNTMHKTLAVMRESITAGLNPNMRSDSKMAGGNAYRLYKALNDGIIEDTIYTRAAAYALAVTETNACMGKIVAAPTAGASGILPGVLIAVAEKKNIDDEKIIDALFVAGEIGMQIAKGATLSGAEGGCQAECGSAAAMAAAGMVCLLGGSEDQYQHAAALAMKSTMGLVCDPVGGLVEVPCIKRNANSASIAITSANMALAGIKSVIPLNEVISAMKKVGKDLPCSLKETSQGGIAATKTAREITNETFGNIKTSLH
ncbi:MAG: L-serine ammonia-lyase, iron-sulfur-dependent, subunit alpha [Clostridiaceae bacterium]|nr:L-serine ammonia-lyase, iron-sulfur-dependent, subunit alpha [Clostridiaceae bacterium]